MKCSSRLIGLMVALSAGSAFAVSAGTTSGMAINNIATAKYTDPTLATNAPKATATSNIVKVTVKPITGFDVVYQSGADDTSPTGTLPTGYEELNALAGATISKAYTVVNNSNIDQYQIDLTPVTDKSTAAPALDTTKIRYFRADASNVKGTEITTAAPLKLANGGSQNIIQEFVIPATAVAADRYSVSPKGTAPAVTNATDANLSYGIYNESSNQNVAGTAPTNGDLEYTRAIVYTPLLTPTPTTPTGTTVVPPTTTVPGTPSNPVNAPGVDATDTKTTGYTGPDPANPTATPNPTPTKPGTSITVSGNDQTAYPPTGVSSVAFKNQVNNSGALADTVKLFPAKADGTPVVAPAADGTFTYPINGRNVVVKFVDSTGATLLPGANTYPTLTVAAGSTTTPSVTNYYTIVTFVDEVAQVDPDTVPVKVGISSGNKSGAVTADVSSFDTINPPGLLFGDNAGGLPNSGLVGPGNAAQKVTSSGATTTSKTDTTTTTDKSAVFPMIVRNTGEYGETYTLTEPTISFPNITGGTTSVKGKYYYLDGTELSRVSGGTSGNYSTAPLTTGATTVGAITPVNTSLMVYLVVDVPADAVATNGTTTATGVPKDVVFTQTVTANYSGTVSTDINNQITVLPVVAPGNTDGITLNKYQAVQLKGSGTFVAPALTAAGQAATYAVPGDRLNYAIVAKNNFNTVVKDFVLIELDNGTTNGSLNTYGDYISGSLGVTNYTGFGTLTTVPYYSTDSGATWSTTSPTAINTTNGVQVYIDTNGSQVATTNAPDGDVIPAGATFQVNLSTTIK